MITNHDNSQPNKNTICPYPFSFDPVSSPSNHQLKNHYLTSFFISNSTVSRKTDHFDISFAIWKLSRIQWLTKPTQVAPPIKTTRPNLNQPALPPFFFQAETTPCLVSICFGASLWVRLAKIKAGGRESWAIGHFGRLLHRP